MLGLDMLIVLCIDECDVYVVIFMVLDSVVDIEVLVKVGVDGYFFKDIELD